MRKSNLIERRVRTAQMREKLRTAIVDEVVRKSGICGRTLYNILYKDWLPELATLNMLERFL